MSDHCSRTKWSCASVRAAHPQKVGAWAAASAAPSAAFDRAKAAG
jgi:hypothetical protein